MIGVLITSFWSGVSMYNFFVGDIDSGLAFAVGAAFNAWCWGDRK